MKINIHDDLEGWEQEPTKIKIKKKPKKIEAEKPNKKDNYRNKGNSEDVLF